jgi:hypothetical protein
MESWIKLNNYPDEYIKCGAVMRIASVRENRENWYQEDIVDLMVFMPEQYLKTLPVG